MGIRYCRSFVVAKHADIPKLLAALGAAFEFEIVRCKNRLSRSYNSSDSAGYRDVQVLVKTAAGWIIELQIIPVEMYDLKNRLGHQDYTKYRLILEAGKRSRSPLHHSSRKLQSSHAPVQSRA